MVLEPDVVVFASLLGTFPDSRWFRVMNSDWCQNSRFKGKVGSLSVSQSDLQSGWYSVQMLSL